MNNVTLMGRLTADPELKTTQSGVSVCSFSIAVDRPFVRQGEERQADFINLVAWRQTAEFISKYFRKGQMIAVTGSIQTRRYDDRDGNKRTAFEVVIDRAYFTGAKQDNDNNTSVYRPENNNKGTAYSNATNQDFEEIPEEEFLPF